MMGGRAKRFCGKEQQQQQKDIGVWSSCFEEKMYAFPIFSMGNKFLKGKYCLF
jgi:hypothetical protein